MDTQSVKKVKKLSPRAVFKLFWKFYKNFENYIHLDIFKLTLTFFQYNIVILQCINGSKYSNFIPIISFKKIYEQALQHLEIL